MKSLPGILIGIAAGVMVGMLVAPAKGKSTRKRIVSDTDAFFKDLQDQLQSSIDTIKSQYNDFVETSVTRTKDAIGQAKRLAKH